jgi:hypothetical protein
MRFVLMLMVLFCAATVAQADDVTVEDAPAAAPDVAPVAVAPAAVVVLPVEVPSVVVAEPVPAEVTVVAPQEDEPWTWTGIGWQLAGYVVPVLGALLTALVGFGIQWLRAKTASLRWQSVLDQLDEAVDTAVASVQQTVVDGLRAAAADGELTKAEADDVFAKALAAVKATMGTKGLAALQSAMQVGQEALEAYLRAKIEAKVGETKAALTSPVVTP